MTLVVICMQVCGRNPWSTQLLSAAVAFFLSVKSVGAGPTSGDGAVLLVCSTVRTRMSEEGVVVGGRWHWVALVVGWIFGDPWQSSLSHA